MDKIDFDLKTLGRDELVELLEYHNRLYWERNAPEISDARYDEIVRALQEIDPENPLLSRIFTPSVAGNGKVRHASPMLSLDKAYSLSALLEWAKKFARSEDELLYVEPKYDGISANFDGRILATRGDGEFGEDISGKIPLIELEAPGYTGPLDRPARGELLIREDDFRTLYASIRKKDGSVYKNSRNAVAGIMGLKDISAMLAQHAKITLADYTLWRREIPLSRLESGWEALKEELAALPYPQDGIVLKFADEAFRRSLGSTAHHPRGEIAYKFTNLRKNTVLLDVEWSSGKNCLTPVAIFAPIDISGTTISRATLHNAENLSALGVMIGDEITVERAGDVIPHIVSSVPGIFRRDPMISACPKCGTAVVRRGPELVCPNPSCPGTILQQLAAAVKCLGIDNLGGATLQKLIDRGFVRRIRDLFDLTAADLLTVEGFAKRSAANLISELEKARTVNDYQLLAALNIPGIGLNIARQLLADHTIQDLRTMSCEELSACPGIGPERAAAIRQELDLQSGYLDELLSAVAPVHAGKRPSTEKTVCFTGKMPEKRSFYEKLAASHGYLPVDDVSKELDLLVAADPSASGGKLGKAVKYGVTTVSLEAFLASLDPAAPALPETEPAGRPVQGELF
ncbi:MAG: hypothetical protein IJS01_07300 [Lentisphaeria bacterium]|nr:hypothetical protein [Lentisphaeria bacterium]